MNTTTHQTGNERTPVQLAGGNVARAAAMLSAIEHLAVLSEDGCDPNAFSLATAIQACAAEGMAELRKADEALSGAELSSEAVARMTPEQFDAALAELQWKATDFTRKAGLVPNTAWRWRKGASPIPEWVAEYLGAMLEIQRLHARYVAVRKPSDPSGPDAPEEASGGSA